jgi:DNA-binding response OmpR family regulator
MRVLLVEDNVGLASAVSARLSTAGFVVDVIGNAADGQHAWAVNSYDAIVLDIMLPDGSGLDLLTRMRRSGRTEPVLLLTALDAVGDRVVGLDAGADDYLVKPFDDKELIARLRALLRRPGAALGERLTFSNLAMDTKGLILTVNGQDLSLTRSEFLLLQRLLRNQGRVTSKETLAESIYSMDTEWNENAVELILSRLRRKLAGAGFSGQISTIRGLGYMLHGTAP